MQKLSRSTKAKLIWPVIYLGLTFVFFITTWPEFLYIHHLLGAIITLTAFILWIIARIQLGNAFTIAPDTKFIVTSGLYSKLRHPVYYFSVLTLVGLCVYLWQLPMLAILCIFVIIQALRIYKEDTLLSQHFGKEYIDYKKATWF